MSWQNSRRLPSMRENSCLGGHGTCLQCRNTTRPLAEEMSLKSSDFDYVRLSHTVPTHSPPTLTHFSCLCLSSSLLSAFHMLSLSLCLNPYHSNTSLSLSLSLPITHSPPHGYARLGQACVLAYMSWHARLRVIGVFADVHHHTSLVSRG